MEMLAEDLSTDAIVARLHAMVRKVLDMEERYDVEVGTLTTDTLLLNLPIDSLALMYVIHSIEESFSVEVPDEQVEEFTTVGSIVAYIQEKGAAVADVGRDEDE